MPFNPDDWTSESINRAHDSDDLNTSELAHHHTLGYGVNQAAPGADVLRRLAGAGAIGPYFAINSGATDAQNGAAAPLWESKPGGGATPIGVGAATGPRGILEITLSADIGIFAGAPTLVYLSATDALASGGAGVFIKPVDYFNTGWGVRIIPAGQFVSYTKTGYYTGLAVNSNFTCYIAVATIGVGTTSAIVNKAISVRGL